MVVHPAQYRWSTFRANALGEAGTLISPHPVYEALGSTAALRQEAYRDLFQSELHSGVIVNWELPPIWRTRLWVLLVRNTRYNDGCCVLMLLRCNKAAPGVLIVERVDVFLAIF
jgi:hypothetical protein